MTRPRTSAVPGGEPNSGDRPIEQGEISTPEAPIRTRARGRRLNTLISRTLFGIGLLALWQLLSTTGAINRVFFSDPISIVKKLLDFALGGDAAGRTIYAHIGITLIEVGAGYVIGAIVGLLLGAVLAHYKWMWAMTEPYFLALYGIPKIALAPLFILVFGISYESKLGIAALEVFFFVFFNTIAGIRQIVPEFIELARLMGARGWVLGLKVIVPAAGPQIFVGLRMAVPFSVIGAIVGEFIASTHGVGWLILNYSTLFNSAGMFSAIIILVLIINLGSALVSTIERRVLRWAPQQRANKTVGAA